MATPKEIYDRLEVLENKMNSLIKVINELSAEVIRIEKQVAVKATKSKEK